MILYDVEIEKLVPPKDGIMEEGIEYCEGWGDHFGMGISVVTAYDYETGFPRIFCKDNIDELWQLMEQHDIIAGFNSKSFDDKIMEAHGYTVPEAKNYDLYLEIKKAAGASKYAKGYNLENCCQVNLGFGKSGDGAMAPVLWQRSQIGKCIDYGLRDIMVTKALLDLCMAQPILDPGNPGTRIFVRHPQK